MIAPACRRRLRRRRWVLVRQLGQGQEPQLTEAVVDVHDDDVDLDYDDNRARRRHTKDSSDTLKLLFHAGKPQVLILIPVLSHEISTYAGLVLLVRYE